MVMLKLVVLLAQLHDQKKKKKKKKVDQLFRKPHFTHGIIYIFKKKKARNPLKLSTLSWGYICFLTGKLR